MIGHVFACARLNSQSNQNKRPIYLFNIYIKLIKANSDRFLAEQEGWFGRLKGKGFYCGVIIMLAAVVELLLASSGDLRQIVYGDIGDDLYKDPVSPYTLLATPVYKISGYLGILVRPSYPTCPGIFSLRYGLQGPSSQSISSSTDLELSPSFWASIAQGQVLDKDYCIQMWNKSEDLQSSNQIYLFIFRHSSTSHPTRWRRELIMWQSSQT